MHNVKKNLLYSLISLIVLYAFLMQTVRSISFEKTTLKLVQISRSLYNSAN